MRENLLVNTIKQGFIICSEGKLVKEMTKLRFRIPVKRFLLNLG